MSDVVPANRHEPKVRASLAFVRSLRLLLYALLVLSAGLSLFASSGRSTLLAAAPMAFGVFLVLFAIYRIALVSQRRYPLRAAFLQIAVGAAVWVLLLPGHRLSFSRPSMGDDLPALAHSLDPRVRALAMEASRGRAGAARYADLLIEKLDDSAPRVREEANQSLRAIFGSDPAAGSSGEEAQGYWRAFLQKTKALDTR